jgi:hypothetical protein
MFETDPTLSGMAGRKARQLSRLAEIYAETDYADTYRAEARRAERSAARRVKTARYLSSFSL